MPCLITKWIKRLVYLIRVTLSGAWIVSLKSSLEWLFTSLPAPPLKPPRNGLGRKERKMIGSSRGPEVSVLLFILAEGSQEDPAGTGHWGRAPVTPCSFQAGNWSLLKKAITALTVGSRPEGRGPCTVHEAARVPGHLASAPYPAPDSHWALAGTCVPCKRIPCDTTSDLASAQGVGLSGPPDIQVEGKCVPSQGKLPHTKRPPLAVSGNVGGRGSLDP